MALRLPRLGKIKQHDVVVGGIGLLAGVIGYYMFIQPRGGLGAYIPGIPAYDESDTMAMKAMQGDEYAYEGEDYQSGLFVAYDDGFTVGNRIIVS